MSRVAIATVFLLVLASACGGSTEVDSVKGGGGSGGNAGNATGGAAGTGGMPSQCQVPTSLPAPYPVTLNLTNTSATPVWLHVECSIVSAILSCADGYVAGLATSADCTTACEQLRDGGGCNACGACLNDARQVDPGGSEQYQWSGNTFTFENTSPCPCHHTFNAPAGKYRFQVAVWDQEFDPYNAAAPSRTVSVDFELPANAPVTVPLGK